MLFRIVKDPIVLALLTGLAFFLAVGARRGHSLRNLALMCIDGVKTAKNILITFVLIGMLTALWRASGCIPAIVCYASGLITPRLLVLLTFLLNAMVSVLTGTAFGTAATMGVICVSIASAMGIPLFWVGGAMLSGVFFGDRCSPVSTSALLVSTVTGTDIYTNIRHMIRTAMIPFLLSCLLYGLAGMVSGSGEAAMDVQGLFSQQFRIHWICLLPAVLILLLALFRVGVKQLMLVSILVAFPIAVFTQGAEPLSLFRAMMSGYQATVPSLSKMIDGGGILSMVRVACIVSIASCYSGIFKGTGMLDFLYSYVDTLKGRLGTFPTVLLAALLTSALACNQTLAIMLTEQLTGHLEEDPSIRAINLEDTAVILAPLIPWGIAGSVPLATCGAPLVCLLGACYLYILPLWRLIHEFCSQ